MTRRRIDQRFLVAITLSLTGFAVGCNAPVPVTTATGEDVLKRNAPKTGTVPVGTMREIKLRSKDGRALNGVVVQIGGKNLIARGGIVRVPEDAWAEATKQNKLVIIGAGFMPTTLPLDTNLQDIVLTPTNGLGKSGIVTKDGGTLASALDAAMVTIPSNLLVGGNTTVTVGTYQPTVGAEAQLAFDKDVAAFMAARDAAMGKPGASAAAPCGTPFVCAPVTSGLGVAVTIDGPIQAGQLDVSIDLAKMLKGWDGKGEPPATMSETEKSDAIAAARILETFRNFDATNDPSYRNTMRDTYGISLDRTLLTFPVKLGDVSDVDGLARVEVDGLAILGARLEVTVLSATAPSRAGALSEAVPVVAGDVPLTMLQSKLGDYVEPARLKLSNGGMIATDNGPDAIFPLITNNGGQLLIQDDDTSATLTPSQLLTNNGGAIISNSSGSLGITPGGGLIANNSGGLVSNNSGGFISNNAGGLVSNNSGGLVSNNSGGLVSNNSGGFTGPTITGSPFFPFEPSAGKYQLLQVGPPTTTYSRESTTGLVEYLWPSQTRVRAIMANGSPLTDWVKTAGDGEFTLPLPENCPIIFFLECELLVRGPDGLPRQAYAMAFAPGTKGTTSVAVDASTTMIAASTLHLINYVPPEYERLTGMASEFEKKAAELAAQIPKDVDLNDLNGGSAKGNGSNNGNGTAKVAYRLNQANPTASPTSGPWGGNGSGASPKPSPKPPATPSPKPTIDPKIIAAKKELDATNKQLSILDGRVAELEDCWANFYPFGYGNDLVDADDTITQEDAIRNANSTRLRAVYDPLYTYKSTGSLQPESFRAINPDSPPETHPILFEF